MFVRPEAKNVVISTKYDAPSGTLVMNASGNLDTALIKVIGHKSMPVGTSATIRWGTNRLRVALVLDDMNEDDVLVSTLSGERARDLDRTQAARSQVGTADDGHR